MRRVVVGGLALVASAAVATVVFAQSGGSEQATSPLPDRNPGEGWIEKEIPAAKGMQARAWSDPAAGCHLATFSVAVSDSVGEIPIRASMQAAMKKAQFTVSDDTNGGLRILGEGIAGLAEVKLVESPTRSGSLLACYWNEREPARCRSICQRILQDQTKASP
jgi:hypothetical protein